MSTPLTARYLRRVTAAALTGVLALSICGAPSAAAAAVVPPCGPLASAPPLPLPAHSAPAGPLLRRLAGPITAVPADAQTGRYTRLHLVMSGADFSSGDCVETVTADATETRWRDEITHSGQKTGVPWHTRGTPAPPAAMTDYGPGDMPGALPGPVPTDARRLAVALDAMYPPDQGPRRARARFAAAGARQATGTAGRVQAAVGDLIRSHDTPLAVRRAILHVLAAVSGLIAHGPVTAAGRSVVAVSITAEGSRHVLFIDVTSGQVIAAEEVFIDLTVAANLAAIAPFSFARTILTDRGRTAHLRR